MKFVDTQGRVEKFAQKRKESEARRAELAVKLAEKAKKEAEERALANAEVKSYKQILAQNQTAVSKKGKKATAKKESAAEVKDMEEVVKKTDTKEAKAE